MASQISILALAVPPLSLIPHSHPLLLSSFVCHAHLSRRWAFWGEGYQGKTDLKLNQTTKSIVFLLVYTLESVHCRASGRWEHLPGKDGQTQSRQSQVSSGSPSAAAQILLRGKSFSQFLHCHFEILTTPSNQSRKDFFFFFIYIHINTMPSPAWIGKWVISQSSPLLSGILPAVLWAEAPCSWARRTCIGGVKEGQRLWANKHFLIRTEVIREAVLAGKSTIISSTSPTGHWQLPASIPAKYRTETAARLRFTRASMTHSLLCLAVFLFPK